MFMCILYVRSPKNVGQKNNVQVQVTQQQQVINGNVQIKMSQSFTSTGYHVFTTEHIRKVDIFDTKKNVMQRAKSTTMMTKTSNTNTLVARDGFDDVCREEILRPDNWIVLYYAKQYTDQYPNPLIKLDDKLYGDLQIHMKRIEEYQKILDGFSKTGIEERSQNYVEFRTRGLIEYFYYVFNPQQTITQLTISESLKYFYGLVTVEGTLTKYYYNLGALFKMELDFCIKNKKTDAYCTKLTTLVGSFCELLDIMIMTYAKDPKRESVYKSSLDTYKSDKQGTIKGNPPRLILDQSESLFQSFKFTITSNQPDKCGTENKRSIKTRISMARLNVDIHTMEFFKEGKTFWTREFFTVMISLEEYSEVIKYDMFLLFPDVETNLFSQLNKFYYVDYAFNVDFFQEMAKVFYFTTTVQDIKFNEDIKTEKKEIDLYLLSKYLSITLTDRDELEDYLTTDMIIVYKLYVYLRYFKKIDKTTKAKDIFIKMIDILKDKTTFDGSNGRRFFGVFFAREEFEIHYHTVLTFLCAKTDNYCQNPNDDFKRTVPDLPAGPNKPHRLRIIISFWIRTILFQRKIENMTLKFTFWLRMISWGKTACQKLTLQDMTAKAEEFLKLDDEGRIKYQWTSELKYTEIDFEHKCLKERTEILRLIITLMLKEIKPKGFELIAFWRIIITYIEVPERHPKYISLMWHYFITIFISIHKKEIKDDPAIDKLIFIYIFNHFEKRIISNLDYYQTAGFYGILDSLRAEDTFNDYMFIEKLDLTMLRSDHYYLSYIAGLKTSSTERGQNDKRFTTNFANMKGSMETMFKYFVVDGKSPVAFSAFELNFLNCRENTFTLNGKNVMIDERACKPDMTDCKKTVNDYSKCGVDFVIQIIPILRTLTIMIKATSTFNSINYMHPYFYEGEDDFKKKKNFKAMVGIYTFVHEFRRTLEVFEENSTRLLLDRVSTCIDSDLETQKPHCSYGPLVYQTFYWMIKHSYMANKYIKEVDLNYFNEKMPIAGTAGYFSLVYNTKTMTKEFDSLCLEQLNNNGKTSKICIIKALIDIWITQLKDSKRSPDSIQAIYGNLISALRYPNADYTKTEIKLIILESTKVFFYLFQRSEEAIEKIKDSMNYFMATSKNDIEKNTILIIDKIFKFDSKDTNEVKLVSEYLILSFAKKQVAEHEQNFQSVIIKILDKSLTGTDKSLFDFFSKFNCRDENSIMPFFLEYSTKKAHFSMITQYIFTKNYFFEFSEFNLKKDFRNTFISKYEKNYARYVYWKQENPSGNVKDEIAKVKKGTSSSIKCIGSWDCFLRTTSKVYRMTEIVYEAALVQEFDINLNSPRDTNGKGTSGNEVLKNKVISSFNLNYQNQQQTTKNIRMEIVQEEVVEVKIQQEYQKFVTDFQITNSNSEDISFDFGSFEQEMDSSEPLFFPEIENGLTENSSYKSFGQKNLKNIKFDMSDGQTSISFEERQMNSHFDDVNGFLNDIQGISINANYGQNVMIVGFKGGAIMDPLTNALINNKGMKINI